MVSLIDTKSTIATDITRLYSRNPELDVVDTHYEDEAVYEDGITYLKGKENIKKAFLASSKLFSEVHIKASTETTGKDTIVIVRDVDVRYRIVPFFFSYRIITIITLVEDKVIRHEDVWSVQDSISNIPIFGYFYRSVFKTVTGVFVESALKLINTASNGWQYQIRLDHRSDHRRFDHRHRLRFSIIPPFIGL